VTLQAKLDTLNTLELDSSKVANYNFSVSEFENAKASKQQEIFKAASDLSITSLTIAGTATDVSTEVGRLDRESGKKEELEAIEKLSSEISTVPTQDESVGKFVTFLDKYSDNFAEAQRIIATNPTPQTDSHEEKLVIVAKKIVKKLSEFEVNFKANIGTYIAKIKDESDKVSAINRNNSALKKAQFLQAITEIEKIEASAIVLMNEKDKNVLIVALTNTDYKNKYTEVVNKLSLLRITITTANDSNTKSIALAQQLRDKKVAVINAYDMEIPSITTSFDITNQGLVSNLSQKIQEAFLGLQVID
jgi:vacuolar-type H+-ATPase subunit I/STV1